MWTISRKAHFCTEIVIVLLIWSHRIRYVLIKGYLKFNGEFVGYLQRLLHGRPFLSSVLDQLVYSRRAYDISVHWNIYCLAVFVVFIEIMGKKNVLESYIYASHVYEVNRSTSSKPIPIICYREIVC